MTTLRTPTLTVTKILKTGRKIPALRVSAGVTMGEYIEMFGTYEAGEMIAGLENARMMS